MKSYAYAVEGTAADGQTWKAAGKVTCLWHQVFDLAMREAFEELTGGRAVYGKPGVGCKGPYDITAMHITAEGEDQHHGRNHPPS